jgi:hypothetical protein
MICSFQYKNYLLWYSQVGTLVCMKKVYVQIFQLNFIVLCLEFGIFMLKKRKMIELLAILIHIYINFVLFD